jgi:hypothetical protein
MARRTALALLVVLVVLSFTSSSVLAGSEPTYILPWPDGRVFTVSSDADIYIYWYWLAKNVGLVRVYLDHTTETLTLLREGSPTPVFSLSSEQVRQAYSPPSWTPPEWTFWDCGQLRFAFSRWEYHVGPLEEGTYTLVWTWDNEIPVNDGLHACRDAETGERLAAPPSLYYGAGSSAVTIVVSD